MLAAAAAVPGVMLHAAAQRAAAIAGSIAGAAPGRFFAELEVNDFPQQARWKVTHRETMLQIAELTGCAVIVKGVFVPPGKPVPEGERKIFLLIEGPNDAAVKKAKAELKKVIEEQTERAMRKESGAGGGAVLGRYTV
jgi:ATP-dependent RNA helicase DDX46/PRP5